jgi:hypothetical protein
MTGGALQVKRNEGEDPWLSFLIQTRKPLSKIPQTPTTVLKL